MHVLITGGAGFIGSHLVEHHLALGDTVHAVDDLSTGREENISAFLTHPRFRFSRHDILTWSELEQAVGWADRIYHMAAVVGVFRVLEAPIKVLATNISACERLLRAVVHGGWKPQVVVASSSEVYGPQGRMALHEELPLVISPGAPPRWNYAISKLADEAFGISYARQHGIPVVVARLFNTVGPRQTGRYGMVAPRFVRQAVRGEALTVFGGGQQTRAFIDVRDTVMFLDQLAGQATAEGLIVNVGRDEEITIEALARRVIERAGSSSGLRHQSYEEAYGQVYEDIPHRRPSTVKLHSLTRHRPVWTLDATLDDLIARARDEEN
ncbi:MAG: NAD-dependent epimerase/dehydratase family protein [Pseudomonadota bacterium]